MAQRTTFAKLQRERAKQAKAEAKRATRQGKDMPQTEERTAPTRRKTMEEMIWEDVQREKAAEEAAKEKAAAAE